MRTWELIVLKKTISIILVLTVLFGMVVVFAAGTQSDPLITQLFAEGEHRISLQRFIEEEIAKDTTLAHRIDTVSNQVGFNFARGFAKQTLGYHSTVTLIPGSSFTLSSGSATVVFSRGSVINVSTGNEVRSGAELTKNQRYFCAENTTAAIIASSTSTGYIDGYYKNEPSQITRFVERLYTEVLNRTYDEHGLQGWVNAIVSGALTGADVARSFVFCTELINRNLSNTAFVEMLYKTMLGRNAEPSGRDSWVGALNSGATREWLFNCFVVSGEFNDICISYGLIKNYGTPIPVGTQIFVTRLYTECLNRNPDLAGSVSWMRGIQSGAVAGAQAARSFVFCTELINRNLSNTAFVDMLYRTMLGRVAEPDGRNSWVGALNSGATREWVFNCFVVSEEFSEICRVLGVRR